MLNALAATSRHLAPDVSNALSSSLCQTSLFAQCRDLWSMLDRVLPLPQLYTKAELTIYLRFPSGQQACLFDTTLYTCSTRLIYCHGGHSETKPNTKKKNHVEDESALLAIASWNIRRNFAPTIDHLAPFHLFDKSRISCMAGAAEVGVPVPSGLTYQSGCCCCYCSS